MPKTNKQAKQSFTLNCHPYPFAVLVCCGMTPQEVNRELKKKFECWVDDDLAANQFSTDGDIGCVIPLGKSDNGKAVVIPLLFNKGDGLTPGDLAHEALHVLSFAYESMGIVWEPGGANEQWTYMLSSFVDQIAQKLKP